MTDNKVNKFFQNEKKFIVGKSYETLRVKSPPYGSYVSNLETCDELGSIIPNSERYLGKYISSQHYGYGDNRGRCDTFIDSDGITFSYYLDYDGTTRFREVKTHMDERINYVMLEEGTQDNINMNGVNEHINNYLLNPILAKEICSFMNPKI